MITINTVCFRPDLAPFTSHIGDTFVLVFLFWFMTEGKMNSSSSVNLSKFGLLFTATFIIPGFLKSLVTDAPQPEENSESARRRRRTRRWGAHTLAVLWWLFRPYKVVGAQVAAILLLLLLQPCPLLPRLPPGVACPCKCPWPGGLGWGDSPGSVALAVWSWTTAGRPHCRPNPAERRRRPGDPATTAGWKKYKVRRGKERKERIRMAMKKSGRREKIWLKEGWEEQRGRGREREVWTSYSDFPLEFQETFDKWHYFMDKSSSFRSQHCVSGCEQHWVIIIGLRNIQTQLLKLIKDAKMEQMKARRVLQIKLSTMSEHHSDVRARKNVI